MSRWERVEAWLTGLDAALPLVPLLSPGGASVALHGARQLLLDGGPRHLARSAPPHTVFVASSTVFTVALEWIAILLARGGRVTVKSPRGLEAWYDALAQTDLPLEATRDRHALRTADRVVLMGSDATVEAVRATLSEPERLLAFGSRHSLAWWTDPAHASEVALDHALYDGRGCMAPTGVFTPLPDAADRLAEALAAVRRRLPLGDRTDAEHAYARERILLARVAGRVVSPEVIELPLHLWRPRSIPGVAQVYRAERFDDVPLTAERISVLGTDAERSRDVRVAGLGRMQLPELDRLHDGVRWLEVV